MEHRLMRPMRALGAPPLWRCNARKKHYPNGVECRELIDKAPDVYRCMCVRCLREEYPYLEEGPPHITREKNRKELEADYVGLYEPAGYTELETPCVVCGKPIKLDGKTAARFRESPDEEAIHVTCLSSEAAQALHALAGGAYALPYLIRRKAAQQEECDGPEDDREEGRPPDEGGTGDP